MTPAAAQAANLNTNLVTNPSFEDVDLGTTCCYSAVKILNWDDGTQPGFAYASAQGYDAGGPLAGGGAYYFSSNAQGEADDVSMPGQVSQNIDVSTGQTATLINSGEAAVKLSAFFTSYSTDGDIGNLHVEFLNSGGTSLGSKNIFARNPDTWRQESGAAFIPVGTTRLKASVYGTPVTFGPDGYIDLVNVQVTEAINELMYIEVDTVGGNVSIKNQSGKSFHIDYYEIRAAGPQGDYNNNGIVDAADYAVWRDNLNTAATLPNDSTPGVDQNDYNVWKANFGSSGNALDPVDWLGLQEQTLAGFPPGNGTGNGWEQAGGSNGAALAESYLTGNSLVANNAVVPLGQAFNPGSAQNLTFFYSVVADDGMGNFTGPGELVQGFVRYVGGAGAISAVPEPSSVLLVGIGLTALWIGSGRPLREQ